MRDSCGPILTGSRRQPSGEAKSGIESAYDVLRFIDPLVLVFTQAPVSKCPRRFPFLPWFAIPACSSSIASHAHKITRAGRLDRFLPDDIIAPLFKMRE